VIRRKYRSGAESDTNTAGLAGLAVYRYFEILSGHIVFSSTSGNRVILACRVSYVMAGEKTFFPLRFTRNRARGMCAHADYEGLSIRTVFEGGSM
jgi:hypothetical protein